MVDDLADHREPDALPGVALVGAIGAILAAVQLLPAFEYLQHTTRIDFGFEAKRNGFPIQDVIQIVFPRVLSLWSPLYVGIVGVVLAGLALATRVRALSRETRASSIFAFCSARVASSPACAARTSA